MADSSVSSGIGRAIATVVAVGIVLVLVNVFLAYRYHYGFTSTPPPDIFGREESSSPPPLPRQREVVIRDQDECTVFRGMSFVITDPNCRPGVRSMQRRGSEPSGWQHVGRKIETRQRVIEAPKPAPNAFRCLEVSSGRTGWCEPSFRNNPNYKEIQ